MFSPYVEDLYAVNKTEYMILEMTPVVSIDSTALLVIHDIVNDFRHRGIQLAFAMVGNRVDKTMRKARLKDHIGANWFFPTVNEAVHYCVRHQHAKRKLEGSLAKKTGAVSPLIDMLPSNVHTGTEIGFSNDLHHENTMLFISLDKDVPMIMSDITRAFKRGGLLIVRAQIEPLNEEGAKHTYFVKCFKTGAKLSESQVERLREDLAAVIQRRTLDSNVEASTPGAGHRPHTDISENRMRTLEQALAREQETNRTIQVQLTKQGETIGKILNLHLAEADLPLNRQELNASASDNLTREMMVI